MMSFWNAIGIPGALAALVLATTPTASAFEYTDGDQRPIQDRDAQETRVSVGIPWPSRLFYFHRRRTPLVTLGSTEPLNCQRLKRVATAVLFSHCK